MILKHKRMIIVISIVLFLLICFLFSSKNEEVVVEPIEEKKEKVVETTIQVDVKGAVKNPGVYEIPEHSRVQDVIKKSGGFLENADTSTINLSKLLKDEMVILIYTKEEIESFKTTEQREQKTDQTCICPKLENDVYVKDAVTNYQQNTVKETKQVSLNNGTAADFESLPGIGPSKANAIVTYRNEHGGFQSIEDIKLVSGIGEATFEKIKAYLTL